ncbi:reverse transcriptase domain-containing protein, partial [Tanacetum coccineum]
MGSPGVDGPPSPDYVPGPEAPPVTTTPPPVTDPTTTTSVTSAQLQAMINEGVSPALGVDDALTWWNAHVKTTTPEAAHAMPWATLKKKMTDKYCPRGEIKKIEAEMWNLKVKGTEVVAYYNTSCFRVIDV